jgi:hypothetical protein
LVKTEAWLVRVETEVSMEVEMVETATMDGAVLADLMEVKVEMQEEEATRAETEDSSSKRHK